MNALRHRTLPTPLGDLTIVCSARGVVATIFDDDERDLELAGIQRRFAQGAQTAAEASAAGSVATAARREARAYFAGRTSFSMTG